MDIDGVLADFISPFLRILAERAGNGPIDPESITDPNFINHPFLTKEMVADCMVEVSYDARFWHELTPLATAGQWQALDELNRAGRLAFITHRYERDSYSIHQVTSDWLNKHGIVSPVVYFTQSPKSELITNLGIKLFVDDRHENCQDVAENTDAKVLMPHRPYNQRFSHPRVKRIQDLDELFTYLG